MQSSDPTPAPTWYGEIRDYFSAGDIGCMHAQHLDLSSYDSVRKHGSTIYQQVAAGNMPPGRPWPADKIARFKQWMDDGYPKGIPTPSQSAHRLNLLSEPGPEIRVRKDVTTLTTEELARLKTAFQGIMDKDPEDPSSYFAQAGLHWLPAPNTYCMHHVPGFNPWHRVYLLGFENALRAIPGCEAVTLPYWDITTPLPEILQLPPFDQYRLPKDIADKDETDSLIKKYVKGYATNRFDIQVISENLRQFSVLEDIERALSKTDWEDFHGLLAGASNNAFIAAHDGGHNSIGETMSEQSVAAFDPVFWFFHCNLDRLFWLWQTKMGANTLNGLISTISESSDPLSYQTFTDAAVAALPPFDQQPPRFNAIEAIDSLGSLAVTYQNPATNLRLLSTIKTQRSIPASEQFKVQTQLANVRIDGINRLKIEGSFRVHLLKNGEILASRAFFQPSHAEECPTCAKNALVHFDFELPIEQLEGGILSIRVEPSNDANGPEGLRLEQIGNPRLEVHLMLTTG